MREMEILSSRVLLRSAQPVRLQRFYRDQLGLAVAREYPGGLVFHAGNGLIEIPSHLGPPPRLDPHHTAQAVDGASPTASGCALWLQVRDIGAAEKDLRDAGVEITRAPRTEPWGLVEMHVADPDQRKIIVVEIPADHPLRRDQRPASTTSVTPSTTSVTH